MLGLLLPLSWCLPLVALPHMYLLALVHTCADSISERLALLLLLLLQAICLAFTPSRLPITLTITKPTLPFAKPHTSAPSRSDLHQPDKGRLRHPQRLRLYCARAHLPYGHQHVAHYTFNYDHSQVDQQPAYNLVSSKHDRWNVCAWIHAVYKQYDAQTHRYKPLKVHGNSAEWAAYWLLVGFGIFCYDSYGPGQWLGALKA
jgi:hypothetical protein